MAISDNIKDREYAKFTLNSKDETSVRTITEVDGGKLSFSGLSERVKITNVTITDTASPIPLVALTNRNSIIIQNRSSTDSFFLGESDVASSGVKEGWEVDATSFFTTDIKETIVLYGITKPGITVDLKIMELA